MTTWRPRPGRCTPPSSSRRHERIQRQARRHRRCRRDRARRPDDARGPARAPVRDGRHPRPRVAAVCRQQRRGGESGRSPSRRRRQRPSRASTSPSSRPARKSSRQLAPQAVEHGCVVIDNSSAWRMEPDVPLVVSQVNPADLDGHHGIIANPNCSTMQLMPLLAALRDAAGLRRVIVDTYQAVSGTGTPAVDELEAQLRAHVAGEPLTADGLPAPDRAQRAARDRHLSGQRLHKGGVEGRRRVAQDPPPARPAGLMHSGPGAGVGRAIRRRSTSRWSAP